MYKYKSKELPFDLMVAVIAFLVYANSLFNGFVLDDDSVILNNPLLKGNILTLFSSIDTTEESQLLPFYRPFTYLTFAIEWHLHAFNPILVRLFNVLLHTTNSFLVYRLARLVNKDYVYAAFLASILFAVHPLHSEGVNFNAGGRNTMLACFFSLTACILQFKSVKSRNLYWAFGGSFLFLAGVFSKETAFMILPCVIIIELYYFREHQKKSWSQLLIRVAPYLLAATFYIIMRWLTLSKLGIQTSIIPGFGMKLLENTYITTDLGSRLLDNIYIIPRYLVTVIWPTALSNRYVIPDDLNTLALPLFGAWVVILTCLIWVCTRGRSAASIFGLIWLIAFWLPVSGLVFFPGSPLADRFIYIPAIGLWILISDQACRFLPDSRIKIKPYGIVAASMIIMLLAALTIKRNLDWRNNLSLHTRFVEQYPENIHARAGLGKVYYGKGKERNINLAEREFEKVVSIDPNFPMIYTYLGNIKLDKGDLNGAMYCYGKALEVYPYDKEARLNKGITLEKLGRPREAITEYLFFLSIPGNSDHLPGGREHVEQRLKELTRP